MCRIEVGVMGATGMVGQQFVRMLEDHPYFKVVTLSGSDRSAGKRYEEAADWFVPGSIPPGVKDLEVTKTDVDTIAGSGVDLVFSALPSHVAEGIERPLARKGLRVFSNAGANRTDSLVPVMIPEVNHEHLALVKEQMKNGKGYIVTNSNCSTAGLALGLRPLVHFGIKSVTVSTYQALSGAGRRGVASLDIMGNILPRIGGEEGKMETEAEHILGTYEQGRVRNADLNIFASCARVGVRDGHLESVVLDLEKGEPEDVKAALESFSSLPQELALPTAPKRPIIVREDRNRPQPILDVMAGEPERARGMAVSVGRIRGGRGNTGGGANTGKKGKTGMFLLVHNTIRGAAGTSVLNAELAYKQGYLEA